MGLGTHPATSLHMATRVSIPPPQQDCPSVSSAHNNPGPTVCLASSQRSSPASTIPAPVLPCPPTRASRSDLNQPTCISGIKLDLPARAGAAHSVRCRCARGSNVVAGVARAPGSAAGQVGADREVASAAGNAPAVRGGRRGGSHVHSGGAAVPVTTSCPRPAPRPVAHAYGSRSYGIHDAGQHMEELRDVNISSAPPFSHCQPAAENILFDIWFAKTQVTTHNPPRPSLIHIHRTTSISVPVCVGPCPSTQRGELSRPTKQEPLTCGSPLCVREPTSLADQRRGNADRHLHDVPLDAIVHLR